MKEGKSLIVAPLEIFIVSDAFLEVWKAYQGHTTSGPWIFQTRKKPTNVLEMKAIKYSISTLTRIFFSAKSLLVHMNHMAAFSYTIRLWGGGCTPNKTLTHLAKDIWDYLISKRIAITVECLHRAINKEVDIPQKRGRTNAIGS